MYYRIVNQAENKLFKALRKQQILENKEIAAGKRDKMAGLNSLTPVVFLTE